jgi:hypothetical protein
VLSDFITSLENFKKTDLVSKTVGKLLINSFYGRLGMGSETSKSIISDNDNHDDYIQYTDKLTIYKKKIIRDSIRNVAVAAAITAKARIKLYNGYDAVLNYGGRLLYSDTDSIIAAFSKQKSPLDINIGDITFDSKKPDTKIKKAVFVSSKTYSLVLENNKEITRIKGVNVNDISFNEINKNFYCNNKITFNDQFMFCKKDYTINIKKTSKTINLNNYNKRLFVDNKTITQPRTY